MRLNLKHYSVDTAENPANANIKGAELRTF